MADYDQLIAAARAVVESTVPNMRWRGRRHGGHVTKQERRRIVAEVRAMQDDQRYGHFTHPVTLGLLLALDVAAGSATPTEDT